MLVCAYATVSPSERPWWVGSEGGHPVAAAGPSTSDACFRPDRAAEQVEDHDTILDTCI